MIAVQEALCGTKRVKVVKQITESKKVIMNVEDTIKTNQRKFHFKFRL